MTHAEMMQNQMMNLLFSKLSNLTDCELMTRKQIEMELQHNLNPIRAELNRRNYEN